jgi:tRNA dimethylallyltransferase
MQVYRELRILTARPSESEEESLPHRLYGTVAASDAYSVGSWLADVASVLEETRAAGRLPILVGGTGLYFKAVTEGLAPIPDIPEEVRAHWREEAAHTDRAGLFAKLMVRDPAMAAKLSQADPQRIVRALEVIDATGVSLAEWQGASGTPVLSGTETLKLVIAPEREDVYAAIDARFDRMLDDGAIEEVSALLALDLDPGLPAMRAHGVVELASFLSGAVDLDQAVAKAKTESRRYAKRQMTWLRRFMADWQWFPDADAAITLCGRSVTL